MKNYKAILRNCIGHITDDYSELWIVTHSILLDNPGISHSQLVKYTMQIIEGLTEKYNVDIVDQNTGKPLKLSNEEIKTIIRGKMDDLERPPGMGDGLWLTAERKEES